MDDALTVPEPGRGVIIQRSASVPAVRGDHLALVLLAVPIWLVVMARYELYRARHVQSVASDARAPEGATGDHRDVAGQRSGRRQLRRLRPPRPLLRRELVAPLDIQILLRTVPSVLCQRGAR